MRRTLGDNFIKRQMFMLREWTIMHIPDFIEFCAKCRTLIDNFIELYNSYAFMILTAAWVVSLLLYRSHYVFFSAMAAITAILTIINKEVNNRNNQFFLTTNFESAIKELDALIAECIQEYMLMSRNSDITFINTDLENELRDETTNMVLAKMSNPLKMKLGALYNKEVIYNIIGSRIYIIIMQFVVETNKPKPSMHGAVDEIVDQINLFN